jgi:hypothetical protein
MGIQWKGNNSGELTVISELSCIWRWESNITFPVAILLSFVVFSVVREEILIPVLLFIELRNASGTLQQ